MKLHNKKLDRVATPTKGRSVSSRRDANVSVLQGGEYGVLTVMYTPPVRALCDTHPSPALSRTTQLPVGECRAA
jgi:hypothetical protein